MGISSAGIGPAGRLADQGRRQKMTNHPNRTTNKPYACVWVSPRGFANEGCYLACTAGRAEDLRRDYADDPDSVITVLGRYADLDKAKGRAARDYNMARRHASWVSARAVDGDGNAWAYDYAATYGNTPSWRRA